MPNLFDYLSWRGDLPLSAAPFNDVDSLILCALCYVRLDGLVPAPGEPGNVTVARAAEEMGLNPSTAKTRLRRGREKLKEHLRKAGFCVEEAEDLKPDERVSGSGE